MKSGRSLFKYFSDCKWAEAFLDGAVLFRSLAYFRDYEDEEIRGDQNEGTARHKPPGGLVVNNKTQGKTFNLPGHAFTSTAKQGEIFVFCASRSMSDRMREEFEGVACVEIRDIRKFCARVQAALPREARFPGRPGRQRIGSRVAYYAEGDDTNPRWALPDVIATSKLDHYAWQDEYRLVFSLTDALDFEKVKVQVVPDGASAAVSNPAEHHVQVIKVAAGFRDIGRVHAF